MSWKDAFSKILKEAEVITEETQPIFDKKTGAPMDKRQVASMWDDVTNDMTLFDEVVVSLGLMWESKETRSKSLLRQALNTTFDQALAEKQKEHTRRTKELETALQKIYDTTEDNRSAAIAQEALTPMTLDLSE